MTVTELYAFNLICENLLAALYGVALAVTYSVSKNDSTILPDNSIWDCAEENVPPHYHILENGFPVNISSKIFVGHEGGFHYEDYYN